VTTALGFVVLRDAPRSTSGAGEFTCTASRPLLLHPAMPNTSADVAIKPFNLNTLRI